FVLQALTLVVLLAYYRSPTAKALLDRVAEYKTAHGIPFVVISTVVAGAILPEIFLVVFFQRARVRRQNFRNLLFTTPMWALDGIIVDLFYRGLAAWLGDEVSLSVVATKILVDQFGYNVFIAGPYEVIAYEWKNSGYSFAIIPQCLNLAYYRNKIVPTLFATWVVWLPLVAMIYSLPLALQFPLFSFALTFWVLLLTYMTNVFAGKNGQPFPAPSIAR
ncbi:MAG: hypothetical protein M3Y69_01060, partial [Verrucomicrobiota bacterium]|nr:hypothetical protein [Verrucomicrobiota bacterium]